MERTNKRLDSLRYSSKRFIVGGLMGGLAFIGAGCGNFIRYEPTVASCEKPTSDLTAATPDEGAQNYNWTTDPHILAREHIDATKREMNNHGIILKSDPVRAGLGVVACEGSEGGMYLTEEGERIRSSLVD